MPLFTASFVPPPAITDLEVSTVDPAAILLEWAPSTIAPEDFRYYQVARSVAGGPWVLLATLADQAATSYMDYAAPIGPEVAYRVTQSNLDEESDPNVATVTMDECSWWLVTPGAPDASFEVPNVTALESEWPLQSEEHEPLGRTRKLVETGVLLGEEGSATAYLEREHDPAVLALLRGAASGASSEVLFKSPYGEVFAVSVGTIKRTRRPGGAQEVEFRFVAV